MENIDKNYKSPKPKNKVFTKYWNLLSPEVIIRDNFKPGHLEQLQILCQLYCEFHQLSEIITEEGYFYTTETRNGTQQKISAPISIREKVISAIRQYSTLLGLVLMKDNVVKEDESDDWS